MTVLSLRRCSFEGWHPGDSRWRSSCVPPLTPVCLMSQKNLKTLARMGPPGAAQGSLASWSYLSSFGMTFLLQTSSLWQGIEEMKLYRECMSVGRAPKERCGKWMWWGRVSGRGCSAEVVKTNVHKKTWKNKGSSFLLFYVELVAPLLILQRNKKKNSTWIQSPTSRSCRREWSSSGRSSPQTVVYHLQDKVPAK